MTSESQQAALHAPTLPDPDGGESGPGEPARHQIPRGLPVWPGTVVAKVAGAAGADRLGLTVQSVQSGPMHNIQIVYFQGFNRSPLLAANAILNRESGLTDRSGRR